MINEITPQKGLFDICERKHGGVATSVAANRKVNKELDRAKCLNFIRAKGTATSKEIARYMNKPLNSVSGRCSELLAIGAIERTSERRDGCAALRVKI